VSETGAEATKSLAPRVLKKGDKVWVVVDNMATRTFGTAERPARLTVRQGKIMGGGDRYVLVSWQEAGGAWHHQNRERRRWLQETVSATKAEALARYRSYLPARIERARREVDKLIDLGRLVDRMTAEIA
jgi:hypothetical protein